MRNWWIDEQGRNNLAGVDGDPTNPPALPDEEIVEFLIRIPAAQRDFRLLLPNMLPAEQLRLNALTAAHPRTLLPYREELEMDASFQRKLNNDIPFYDPNRRR